MINKLKIKTNPVLPTSYSTSLSYYEEICKLRNQLNDIIKLVDEGQEFYILPIATDNTLGGVVAKSFDGENARVAVDEDGRLWYDKPEIATAQEAGLVKGAVRDEENRQVATDSQGRMWYCYPETANAEVAGVVKAILTDSTTGKRAVSIDEDGQLYASYPLTATSQEAGLVRPKDKTNETVEVAVDRFGRLFAPEQEITRATSTKLGGIVASPVEDDDGFTEPVKITNTGALRVAKPDIPTASATEAGAIKAKERTVEDRRIAVGDDGFGYYTIPKASDVELGGVKAKTKTDETVEVAVDGTGKLYVPASTADIAPASDSTLGGVKAKPRTVEDRKVAIGTDNYIYYTIPTAKSNEIGGVVADTRNPAVETQEVKIDDTTHKLYVQPAGGTDVPQATSTTLGGIKANARTTAQTNEVAIDPATGLLYTEPTRFSQATSTNLGGILVGQGGTEQVKMENVVYFYPDAINYPLMEGARIPYSCFAGDGRLDTFNTEVFINLGDTAEDEITATKLRNYIAYAEQKGFEIKILANYNHITYTFNYAGRDNNMIYFSTNTISAGDGATPKIYALDVQPAGTEDYAYVVREVELGGGGGGGDIPQATPTTIGGIKAPIRDITDTQEVRIEPSTGMLYTQPSGGGGDGIHIITPEGNLDQKMQAILGNNLLMVGNIKIKLGNRAENYRLLDVVSYTPGELIKCIRKSSFSCEEFDEGGNTIDYELVNLELTASGEMGGINIARKSVEFLVI